MAAALAEAVFSRRVTECDCRQRTTAMDGSDGAGLREEAKLGCFETSGRHIEISKGVQNALDPVFNVDSDGGLRFKQFPNLWAVTGTR